MKFGGFGSRGFSFGSVIDARSDDAPSTALAQGSRVGKPAHWWTRRRESRVRHIPTQASRERFRSSMDHIHQENRMNVFISPIALAAHVAIAGTTALVLPCRAAFAQQNETIPTSADPTA